jgi:hypothetical protein
MHLGRNQETLIDIDNLFECSLFMKTSQSMFLDRFTNIAIFMSFCLLDKLPETKFYFISITKNLGGSERRENFKCGIFLQEMTTAINNDRMFENKLLCIVDTLSLATSTASFVNRKFVVCFAIFIEKMWATFLLGKKLLIHTMNMSDMSFDIVFFLFHHFYIDNGSRESSFDKDFSSVVV